MRALIVDEGRERSSVAAARALRAGGWSVGAASPTPNLASWSKATDSWHRVRHTSEGDEAFLESLSQAVREGAYEAVFVTWERAVDLVSSHRDELGFDVGYGPHEGLVLAMDKLELSRLAPQFGVAVPPSADIAQLEAGALSGPLVVKPALQSSLSAPARRHEELDGALAHARAIEQAGGRALIQQAVAGDLIALTLVRGEQGTITIAQQVAEHVWPQPVGVTARGLTVAVEDGLRAGVERLFERLQWRGLAQLQFIRPQGGEPLLIDINPRLYGSLALAIRAGANHPDAWARLMSGRETTFQQGRPGVRYQWFSRDLRASLAQKSPARGALECLRVGASSAHSLWSPGEPTLAPRFLGAQALRAARRRLEGTDKDLARSALLHGVAPVGAARRALRSRPVPPRPARIGQRVLMKAGRLGYEDGWLTQLHEARVEQLGQAAHGTPKLLVRVDEFPYYSGYNDPRFGYEASLGFHEVMAAGGVAHLMSVVPQWTNDPLDPSGSGGRPLDDRDVALLERMRSDGVTLAQHGGTHRTRFADPRRHSELCGLGPAELDALLEQGRAKLAAAGVEPRIFVPPFNRFDSAQWEVLAARYEIVTGGPESVLLMGFQGGPLWRGEAVYLPCYAPLYGKAAEILPAVEQIIERQIATWVPIVLHTGWEIDDDFAALRRLAERIGPLAASWEDLLASVEHSRES